MTPHERDYQNGSTFTLHTHTIYSDTYDTFFSALQFRFVMKMTTVWMEWVEINFVWFVFACGAFAEVEMSWFSMISRWNIDEYRAQIARRNESLCRRSFWVNWFCFACCSFRYCAWMSCAAMESANQFWSNLILFLMCEGRKIANARLRSDVKRYCLFYESVARYAYLMA